MFSLGGPRPGHRAQSGERRKRKGHVYRELNLTNDLYDNQGLRSNVVG